MSNEIQIVEHQSERVLTTEQLAEAYGCDAQRIKQNFNNNKEHFQEGKHYFRLDGVALQEFKNRVENFDLVGKRASVLYLWTKRGASRHCKMLGTDKAWDMFDQLEENYFNPQPKRMSQLEILQGSINQLVEHEHMLNQQKKQLEEHEARLLGMEEKNTEIASSIEEIKDVIEEKVYAYPDKKKRDKLRNSVYAFAREYLDVFQAKGEAATINDVISIVNGYLVRDFLNDGINLSKELEQAKQFYMEKYSRLHLARAMSPDVLRPAKIRDLSIQSLISTSAEWMLKATGLLTGYKMAAEKARREIA